MTEQCPRCGQAIVRRVGGGIRGPRVWSLCPDDACDWVEWTEPEGAAAPAAHLLRARAFRQTAGEAARG